MQHITYTPGGSAAELSIIDSPIPQPGPGEVLIQVAYAGVGGTDLAQRRGKFNPAEGCPSYHRIMGLEVSGLVEAVGEGVQGLEKGARVCALVYGGGYAQWTVAPQEQVSTLVLIAIDLSLFIARSLARSLCLPGLRSPNAPLGAYGGCHQTN